MLLDPQELAAALEAVIFVSSEPVTMKVLQDVFPDETEESLAAGLERLSALFEQPGRGLLLDRVAGGWRIATRPDVHAHVGRIVQREKAERLSIRTLETLSVIAYKQPVTGAEIAEIRGVDVSGTVRTLMDRGLIRVAGRKRVVGRPFVYGTTRKFLTSFGLDDLAELPTLKELEDLVTDVPTTDPSEVDPDDVAPEPESDADADTGAAEGTGMPGAPDDDGSSSVAGPGGAAFESPDTTPPARRVRRRQASAESEA